MLRSSRFNKIRKIFCIMLGYQLCSFSHELFFCNSCESALTNEFFAVGSRVRNQSFWHDQLSDNGKPNIYNHATHSGSLCLLALSVIKLAFIPLFLYCNAAPSNRHVTHVSFAYKKVKLGRQSHLQNPSLQKLGSQGMNPRFGLILRCKFVIQNIILQLFF